MNKRIIDWTGDDLSVFLDEYFLKEQPKKELSEDTVRGLKAIADILHCSVRQASRLKKQGVLDDGISQIGNIIIGYPEKLKALNIK